MSLKDTINNLERLSASLEPNSEERQSLSASVMKITEEFLQKLSQKKAYESDETAISLLDEPFDEDPLPVSQVLDIVKHAVDEPGINPASGNHLGYVPGGGLFTSSLADYWADITDRYAGVYFANPGAVKMENELIRWLIQLVGFPSTAWGNLASGGSIANLTAIVAARDARQISGTNAKQSVIYVSAQTHHCIAKAIHIAGLSDCIVRQVTLDSELRMSAENLQQIIQSDKRAGLTPFLLVTSAGTTDAGVIDPIGALDIICKQHDIWHHVDGAYGGFFLLLSDPITKLQEVANVDSIVLDPHKSLFLPYGLGIVLVADINHLRSSFSYQANYMQDASTLDEEPSPADVSPELTKHFRGLRMWLPMKLHGLAPFRNALHEKLLLAKYFYQEILKIDGFEVYQPPELTVVMFRYTKCDDKNLFNKLLIDHIHADGRIFLSSTSIDGEIWLRAAVLVFRTHLENVNLTLSVISELSSKLCHSESLPS